MIDRRGDLGFRFKLFDVVLIGAEFLAQQFERHDPVQVDVPRLVNGSHAARGDRFDEFKVVELPSHPHRDIAVWAADFGEGFLLGNIEHDRTVRALVKDGFYFGRHGFLGGYLENSRLSMLL